LVSFHLVIIRNFLTPWRIALYPLFYVESSRLNSEIGVHNTLSRVFMLFFHSCVIMIIKPYDTRISVKLVEISDFFLFLVSLVKVPLLLVLHDWAYMPACLNALSSALLFQNDLLRGCSVSRIRDFFLSIWLEFT